MNVIGKCSSERHFWNSMNKDTSLLNWQYIDPRITHFRRVDLSWVVQGLLEAPLEFETENLETS